MKPFTTWPYESPLSRTLNYHVHGYWSNSAVRVYQHKNIVTGEWASPEVDWSTGGQDHKEEPDNLIAAECFAKAILDAVEQAKKWKP